ncbi:hypothetical protein MUK42_07726 [Musa troglodytarum]|uniref:Uncharacterized protein n=1 Tax=Musa troglodytarum TaxID=320322 RepID=A0A9E7KMN0_9LILI|nr:hypothetical protein MUK42_07726 [Musa troglodytarum]
MKLPTGGYPPLSSGMLASFVTCADAAMAGIMPPPLLELQLDWKHNKHTDQTTMEAMDVYFPLPQVLLHVFQEQTNKQQLKGSPMHFHSGCCKLAVQEKTIGGAEAHGGSLELLVWLFAR